MPRASSIDRRTRLRIAAYLRLKSRQLGLRTNRELAVILGVHEGTVSRVLRGVGSIGLDVVLAMHRQLHIDANALLDVDPFEPKVRP